MVKMMLNFVISQKSNFLEGFFNVQHYLAITFFYSFNKENIYFITLILDFYRYLLLL
jgi:hypothetical protein